MAGMGCTGVAIILIIVGESLDFNAYDKSKFKEKPFKVMNLFSALGTFLFTYAGHSSFPTIQHDMK